MSRPSPAPVPHVDESYRLAQLLRPDQAQASQLVHDAFRQAGQGRSSRFAVLHAVILSAGLRISETIPQDSSDFPPEPVYPAPRPESIPGPESEFRPAFSDQEPPAMVTLLAGKSVAHRLLPVVFSGLPAVDRVLGFLDASGISNAADLGAVLGLSAPEALQLLVKGRSRLAAGLLDACTEAERGPVALALQYEAPRELLRQVTDVLLEPAPSTLHDRLRPASGQAGSAGTRVNRGTVAPRTRLKNSIRIVAFLLAATLVGYGIRSFKPTTPQTAVAAPASDLVTLAIEAAGDVRPAFRATSAEQAEVFILDRVGQRILVPAVESRRLEGVGVHVFAGDTETPALVYGGPDSVPIFVFSYAYLDRVAPHFTMDPSILEQVTDEGRFAVVDQGRKRALVFRNRDDLYVAVTSGDPMVLQGAISFPE